MTIQYNPNLLPNDAPDPALIAKHEGVPVLSHPLTLEAEQEAEIKQQMNELVDAFAMDVNRDDEVDEVVE